MKIVLQFTLTVLLLHITLNASEIDKSIWKSIAPRYRHTLYYSLNANTNVHGNSDDVESTMDDHRVLDVHLYKVPKDSSLKINDYFSDNRLQIELLKYIFSPSVYDLNNFSYGFVVNHKSNDINKISNEIVNNGGEFLATTYKAIKVPSHSTFFVWKPYNFKTLPFYLKSSFTTFKESMDTDFDNHHVLAKSKSNLIQYSHEEYYHRHGKIPEFSYMPYLFQQSFWMDNNKATYSNLIRFPNHYTDSSYESAFWKTIPLHGFLGSKLIDDFSKIKSLSRRDWLRTEYLPKLGKAMAQLHYHTGYFHQGHTQNILVRANLKTGELGTFIIRDLQDGFFDPFNKNVRRFLPTLTDQQALQAESSLTEYWISSSELDSIKEAGFPGLLLALYLGQSINGAYKDFYYNQNNIEKTQRIIDQYYFFKSYIQEVQAQTKLELMDDYKTRTLLSALKRGDLKHLQGGSYYIKDSRQTLRRKEYRKAEYGNEVAFMENLFSRVFNIVNTHRFTASHSAWKSAWKYSNFQNELFRIFWRNRSSVSVTISSHGQKIYSSMEYGSQQSVVMDRLFFFIQDGKLAYNDLNTGELIGFLVEITPEDRYKLKQIQSQTTQAPSKGGLSRSKILRAQTYLRELNESMQCRQFFRRSL